MAKNCKDCQGHNHDSDPFDNLDSETKNDIQELQMIEQSFRELLMQKNAYSLEENETDLIIREVEKTNSPISKIVAGKVIINTTKEEILKEMNHKKELLRKRMESILKQEEEYMKKIESLREKIIKKIQERD